MSYDLRDEFQPPIHNCGNCTYWPRNYSVPTEGYGTQSPLEATCLHESVILKPTNPKGSHYENGWRRASDRCEHWKKVIAKETN